MLTFNLFKYVMLSSGKIKTNMHPVYNSLTLGDPIEINKGARVNHVVIPIITKGD